MKLSEEYFINFSCTNLKGVFFLESYQKAKNEKGLDWNRNNNKNRSNNIFTRHLGHLRTISMHEKCESDNFVQGKQRNL